MVGIMMHNMSHRLVTAPAPITSGTLNNSVAVNQTNGSPFSPATNTYTITAPGSVPPYNYVSVSGNSNFNVGTGDFTIEWFQYQTDSSSFARPFWYSNLVNATYWGVSIEGGTFYFWNSGANTMASSVQLSTYKNAWVHFAVVRSSGNIKLYKNGTAIGNTVANTSNMSTTTGTLAIGGKPYGSNINEQFGGSITNWRMSSIAVYTGNFTTPTSPLGTTQSAGTNISAITYGQAFVALAP
jgi:hypothetical protein